VGTCALHFNAEYPLNERKRDSQVTLAFEEAGLDVVSFDGSVVLPPGTVLTGSDDPYTVFTPFKKRWLASLGNTSSDDRGLDNLKPPRASKAQKNLELEIEADAVPDALDGVGPGLHADTFPGGEKAALKRMAAFCKGELANYHKHRDLPALPGTSSLSPYLSVGALSPRRCFAAAGVNNAGDYAGLDEGASVWLSEVIWREFYRHVIAQFPHVSQSLPFKRDMKTVRWRHDEADFAAWCRGETGYPIVDAAQRQLLATGWMHNRLRMITAMFLTKHLLIDWRWGEAHFMRELIDGDFASNNGGWQWSASTGTDAAPYFRIFNPITQAKRFDGAGEFIHTWVPELRDLSGKALLEPWTVGGHDYPAPIVDHKFARERALAAFKN
jgi:deoxyribodipyrimidine photo-lyase